MESFFASTVVVFGVNCLTVCDLTWRDTCAIIIIMARLVVTNILLYANHGQSMDVGKKLQLQAPLTETTGEERMLVPVLEHTT